MWAGLLAPGGRLVIDYPIASDALGVLSFEDLKGNRIFSWEVADSDSWGLCEEELETLVRKTGLQMGIKKRLYPEQNRFGIEFIRNLSTAIWVESGESGQPNRSFVLRVAELLRIGMRNYWFSEPMWVLGRPRGIPRNKVVSWLAVLRQGN
jgi:hypothetical protein